MTPSRPFDGKGEGPLPLHPHAARGPGADDPPAHGAHLSTLRLHQLRTGELGRDEARTAQAHVAACPVCRDRLKAQLAFRRAFEVQPPPVALPPRVPGAWSRWSRWLRWTPMPLLLAALALIVIHIAPPHGTDTRLKGGKDVVVLVAGHGALVPGEAVHPGDRLQLRVPAGDWQEAWVGDADGLIGHFALRPDQPTLSPFALTVDDQLGDEQLVIVLSTDPLDQGSASAALRGRRMDGVVVRRLPLHKER